MPTIKEKVANVFKDRIGEEFLREGIIELVVIAYSGTNPTSVIPSDYCYNMVNAGINFDFHHFESLGEHEGRYRCLRRCCKYTGRIYWKPVGAACEQVGEWKDGRFRLRQNAPPNLIERYGVDRWIAPCLLEVAQNCM
jgi:hypothetical protein